MCLKKTQGIITELNTKSSFAGKLKEIDDLVDDLPIITQELWKLIQWMSEYYVTPLGQVGKAVLPKNLSTRYSPPKNWMVQPIMTSYDGMEADKKRAPKQYELYQEILKTKQKRSYPGLGPVDRRGSDRPLRIPDPFTCPIDRDLSLIHI